MSFDPTESAPRVLRLSSKPRTPYVTLAHPRPRRPQPLERRLVIGRQPPSGGVALDDNRASRQHAELSRVRGRHDVVRLRDLGSKNGTWLNGLRIEQEYVSGSAVIRVGDSVLVFSEVAADFSAPVPVGRSPAIERVYARADRAGQSGLPVLIHGPSGAGKERLAARVHAASDRAGPLVAVNCATFSGELLASELFGHVRGAFSGAQTTRDGLFASARGGTIFLDEIAEMPLAQQPALLRVLQEGRIRPVGSDREIDVDVRVIAASHRDLEALVADDQFRGDLFARLAGVRLALPGLADRREEILPLFQAFLGDGPTLDADAAEALLLYDWPYNVRELKHLAQALRFELGGQGAITPDQLPTAIQETWRKASAPFDPGAPLDDAALRTLLSMHGGNVSAAARAVDLTRQQLYRRLQAAGIDPTAHREGE